MKNFKSFLIITFLLFTTCSFFLSPILIGEIKEFNYALMIISLVIIIVFYHFFNINKLKIKEILSTKILKNCLLIYIFINMIFIISIIVLLINNFYYQTTPITIFSCILMIMVIILSLNKRIINLNLFLFFSAISIIIFLFFIFTFPNSNLKIVFNLSSNNYFYFGSYLICLIDIILYQLFFTNNDFKFNKKKTFFSLIVAFLVIFFFLYKDLTIVDSRFFYTNFPNILKFKLATDSKSTHFDFLLLIVMISCFIMKMIIYGETFRILSHTKKTNNYYIVLYIIVFFIANTLANQIKIDNKLLNIELIVLNIICVITIILLGGIYVVKRIFSKKQTSN